ncbi:MAG: hypothetical protein KJ583_05360 [Nanoarchaeota archaeon]|nr:hypothetical protein [Nanoarchaeota archaeon]MBU1269550.1 hypothetical protein [Nanoarchaeota archaeon]MBU1604718.1 hypothetical protein [Nanoarchaeota archaeon]MBU2443811.1 hypothetical protein [Nanoarchaeota archaeon]
MDELRIKNISLDELVSKVRKAGYEDKYSLDADKKIWRMYTKETENILQAAYISDFCEVFATETFRKLGNHGDEQTAVRGILFTYQNHITKIDEAGQTTFLNTGIYIAVGAALGLMTRHPIGVAFGAGIGYYLSHVVKSNKIETQKTELDDYLSSHNIYIGKSALKKLNAT